MISIIQKIWPSYCLLCKGISAKCLEDLPWNRICCYRCGLPISKDNHTSLCGACITNPPIVEHTTALFLYQAPITQFITQLKFNRRLLYANILGNLFFQTIRDTRTTASLPECIIPVPLHPKRLRERGFNQAVEIAKPIGKKLKLPVLLESCIREKYTEPQMNLPAKKRKQNIKNAFSIKTAISAKHIAIVDDVVTTGSTAAEIGKLLKKQGVEKIEVWCCARVIV